MDRRRKRTALLFSLPLLALTLGGCALGTRLGWNARVDAPTEAVRASCNDAVRTLEGEPDHATALRACLEAKTRQGVRS